jgi:hypothetical protein
VETVNAEEAQVDGSWDDNHSSASSENPAVEYAGSDLEEGDDADIASFERDEHQIEDDVNAERAEPIETINDGGRNFAQVHDEYLRHKDWWPAENYTSLALAAWQSWARVSQEKLQWLLDFLRTGEHPPPDNGEVDLSFRACHVPSRSNLNIIVNRLPKCRTTKVSCSQQTETYDGPVGKRTVSSKDVDVQIILPSEILRRELANQAVAASLCLGRSQIGVDDLEAQRRHFVDSVYYGDQARVRSPYICFDHVDKAYVGEAVLHQTGKMYIIVDITNDDPKSPMSTTIRVMNAHLASKLSRALQTQVHAVIQNMNLNETLQSIMVIEPLDSNGESWNPEQYRLISRDSIVGKIQFRWKADDTKMHQPLLLLQISSIEKKIEPINTKPFESNYKRWRPFDTGKIDAPLFFQIYADGFSTWLSRSGSVVAIYLSLSQLPVENINQSENINLVALVPAGVDIMDVFRVISHDIASLQSRPSRYWVAKPALNRVGQNLTLQPIFSFLKGDTPQRAIYTSTAGSSGRHFCHGCNATGESFLDPLVLTDERRSAAQWKRVRRMLGECKTNAELGQIRLQTGFVKDALSVGH